MLIVAELTFTALAMIPSGIPAFDYSSGLAIGVLLIAMTIDALTDQDEN